MRGRLATIMITGAVTLAAVLPQAEAAAAPSARAEKVTTYVVTRAGVNYRTGPGTQYRSLGVLRQDGILAAPGRTSAGWTEIYLSDTAMAWVSSVYLAKREFPVYRVVADDGVNIRTGPGTQYRLVGALRYGTIVPGTKTTSAGWIQLQLSAGDIVWASSRYLAKVPSQGITATPTSGNPSGPLDPRRHHGKVCRLTVPSSAAC